MATTGVEPTGLTGPRRTLQLPVIDVFLWVVRIGAVLFVVRGAWYSLTSGRLEPGQWRNLVIIGIAQGSVYALIALGYTMVYGVLRFINFAHGEVFMVGAITGYFVTVELSSTSLWEDQIWLALLFTLACCVAASTTVALLLERICYRPLRGLPRLIPFITAIGASFFLQYAVAGLFGNDIKDYPNVDVLDGSIDLLGWFPIDSVNVFGWFHLLFELPMQKRHILTISAAALVMVGLYWYVERTRAGKAIRAVAEDQEIARLMGIDVDKTIARVFGIGGALAGLAGMLFGLVFERVYFRTGFLPGIKAFTAAVLGGIGNIWGAAVGGLFLGSVESLGPSLVLEGYEVPAAHQLKDVVAFSVLVLVLIFRPSGLLGERVSEERA